jgi:hypothetical protein
VRVSCSKPQTPRLSSNALHKPAVTIQGMTRMRI